VIAAQRTLADSKESNDERSTVASIQVVMDAAGRGLTVRCLEAGLERHVWVDWRTFQQFLAAGETIYVDTPAIATEHSRANG